MRETQHQEWRALVPDGTDAHFIEVCGSTNTLATEAGTAGNKGPMWFIAGRQDAGRGRRGRPWASANGNLYCSYLFGPDAFLADLAALPFLTALAVRDTLVSLGCAPDAVKCKWPNDVLVDSKKISGILIESSAAPGLKTDFAIVGIGINLVHFPSDAQFSATSVADETGSTHDVATAFKILSHVLHERLATWNPRSPERVANEWRQHAWGMGKRREIRTNDETFFATLMGLDDTGGLVLRLDDGNERTLFAGDVFTSPQAS